MQADRFVLKHGFIDEQLAGVCNHSARARKVADPARRVSVEMDHFVWPANRELLR